MSEPGRIALLGLLALACGRLGYDSAARELPSADAGAPDAPAVRDAESPGVEDAPAHEPDGAPLSDGPGPDRSDVPLFPAQPAGTTYTVVGSGAAGFADGERLQATFGVLWDVLWTADGLYIADPDNAAVRRLDPDGTVRTVVGRAGRGFRDGAGGTAQVNRPVALARGPDRSVLFVDEASHSLRRLEADGRVTTLAGTGTAGFRDGPGAQAQFRAPRDVSMDGAGVIYVADKDNYVIRRVAPDGMISLHCGVAGVRAHKDGDCATVAHFDLPVGIEPDGADGFYIVEFGRDVIRRLSDGGVVSTVIGLGGTSGWADGTGAEARLTRPSAARLDPARGWLWFTEQDGGNRLRRFDGLTVKTVFGPTPTDGTQIKPAYAEGTEPRFGNLEGLDVGDDGCVYLADRHNRRVRRACP